MARPAQVVGVVDLFDVVEVVDCLGGVVVAVVDFLGLVVVVVATDLTGTVGVLPTVTFHPHVVLTMRV